MGERVFVVGVGMTDFVKPSARPGWDYPDMVREAGTQALDDAGLSYPHVQHVAAGYCFGDTTAGQRAVYELGLTGVPVVNVNNACASGSTALMVARAAVAAGMADQDPRIAGQFLVGSHAPKRQPGQRVEPVQQT